MNEVQSTYRPSLYDVSIQLVRFLNFSFQRLNFGFFCCEFCPWLSFSSNRIVSGEQGADAHSPSNSNFTEKAELSAVYQNKQFYVCFKVWASVDINNIGKDMYNVGSMDVLTLKQTLCEAQVLLYTLLKMLSF